MRILLSTYGSRGDVQPLVALARALRLIAVDSRLSAPPDPEFTTLAAEAGVPFVPAFMPIREWIAQARASGAPLPQLAERMVGAQYEALAAAAANCDAVVATGLFPSVAAARSVAERCDIAFAPALFCPQSLPSTEHPPYAYPGWPHPPGVHDNSALWQRNVIVMNALFGEAFNGHRARIGLPPVDNVRDHVLGGASLLACDPTLGPWPGGGDVTQTGAWLLPDRRALPDHVAAFLDAGPPPVYVGFGSMAGPSVPAAAETAMAAIRAEGRRIVLQSGWAGLAGREGVGDCCHVGEVNQGALFPRVAAVVHHGGAGTTMAAALSGAPQLIVPQVADQPYWGRRIAALRLGAVVAEPSPSPDALTRALRRMLAPACRAGAAALAPQLRRDGASLAAHWLAKRLRTPEPR